MYNNCLLSAFLLRFLYDKLARKTLKTYERPAAQYCIDHMPFQVNFKLIYCVTSAGSHEYCLYCTPAKKKKRRFFLIGSTSNENWDQTRADCSKKTGSGRKEDEIRLDRRLFSRPASNKRYYRGLHTLWAALSQHET